MLAKGGKFMKLETEKMAPTNITLRYQYLPQRISETDLQ